MSSLPRFSITLLAACLLAHAAYAGPINPGDMNPGSTLLGFDAVPGGTDLSNQFPGVILSSGDSPETPGTVESSSFVRTTNEFPAATHSSPNKIVGTYDSGAGPVGCETCSVVVTFLDPLPTQVAFWVSDPDLGQSALFSGPGGPLGTLTVNSGNSGTPFFMGFEDANGISKVVISTPSAYKVGIDDLQFGTPVATVPPDADQWCSVDTTLHTGLIGFDDGRGTQTLISVEMTPIQTYPPQGFGPTYTQWTIKSTGVQLSGGFYSAKYNPTQSPRAIYKIGRVTCSTPFGDGGLTDFSCVLNQMLTPCSID